MKGTYALIIAVILAIASVLAIKSYIAQQRQEVEEKLELIEVLQADRTIEINTKLLPEHIARKDLPRQAITSDHILTNDYPLILGKVVNRKLDRGDPILWSYLTEEAPVGAPPTLLPGERAVTIAVNQVTGVAGLLKPKSRVDILCTIRPVKTREGETPEEKTLTLLTNVLVLAVDDRTGPQVSIREMNHVRGYSSVTVAVSPLEAQLITYAQRHGVLTLAMRREGDTAAVGKLPEVNSETFRQLIDECRTKREEESRSNPTPR